jgi:hypothetical protein
MEWEDWLEEPIYWDESGKDVLRWKIISDFVKYGLVPFLKIHGYIFKSSQRDLCSRIASGLYANRGKHIFESDWSFCHENIEHMAEEKDHYDHIVNQDEWDKLWDLWRHWDDIGEDSFRGIDRRFDIQEYCWTQLDLECSPQTRRILEMVGIYENGAWGNKDHSRKMDDPYLKEANESGQYDGYRR